VSLESINLKHHFEKLLCCCVTAFVLWAPAYGNDRTGKATIGSEIKDFQLSDYRGKEWSLRSFSDRPILVVSFLGTQCPLAKLYSERLVQLEKQFAERGVAFIAIDANDQDSLAEMAAHARKHEMEFPFLKDAGQSLADALGVDRTPEICVLDKDRKICYRGKIDDQYGVGYARKKPTENYLIDVLNALLEGKDVHWTETEAEGCIIGRRRSAKDDVSVTYSRDVARILQKRCVECHREGDIGPMTLSQYDEVASWSEMILEVVKDGRMPPWHASPEFGHFENDRAMTEEEKTILKDWVEAGCPQGDVADLPPPVEYVTGWQLPREPDFVADISSTPVEIPATGDVKYQYFKVDLPFTEDKWIEAAELLPGNRAVVHHILAFVRPKGTKGDLQAARGFLTGYVPGTRVYPMSKGMAKKIPANSELVFQVHYTPVGTEQTDQSKIGFLFTDPSTIEYEVQTTSAVQPRLDIPPGKANYQVSAMLPEKLPDCKLLSMSPHMHVRGKAFRYTLVHPDGNREVLLDIPKYDFNWQTEYRVSEAIEVKKGARIFCEATFDNSENNLNNPNPKSRVRWGDQTYEEMMIGYFHVAVKRDPATGKAAQVAGNESGPITPRAIFDRLDQNGDGKVEPSEVPSRLKNMIQRLDRNGDGIITEDEVPNG
jgi:peroxiredoxin